MPLISSLPPGRAVRAGADGADARHQFPGVERLRKVIVGAQFEPDDAVFILAARRQHQHRQARFTPDAPQDLKTIEAGQHDVENHQVEAAVQSGGKTSPAVVLAFDAEPFASQQLGQKAGQFFVVIHNQDAHDHESTTAPLTMQ